MGLRQTHHDGHGALTAQQEAEMPAIEMHRWPSQGAGARSCTSRL